MSLVHALGKQALSFLVVLLDPWVISVQYSPGGLLLPEVVLAEQGFYVGAVGELCFGSGAVVSVERVDVGRFSFWEEEFLSVLEIIFCFYNYSHLCSVWVAWINDLSKGKSAHDLWLLAVMGGGCFGLF